MGLYDKVWKLTSAGLRAAAHALGVDSARDCGWLEVGHGPAHRWLPATC